MNGQKVHTPTDAELAALLREEEEVAEWAAHAEAAATRAHELLTATRWFFRDGPGAPFEGLLADLNMPIEAATLVFHLAIAADTAQACWEETMPEDLRDGAFAMWLEQTDFMSASLRNALRFKWKARA